jgi:hypothetical protein
MFPGFFVGTIFLFWLVRTLMWGPRYRHHGYRRPWGPGPFGSGESIWGDFGGFDHAPAPERRERTERSDASRGYDGIDEAVRRFVGALRARLRATPAQERAFDAAVADFRRAADDIRARAEKARDDIAQAVRSEAFDEAAFDEASRRIADAMNAIRDAAKRALADVHDQLDESQRETLADLIRSSRVEL